MAKLLIAHGGAPTAVINASMFGAMQVARRSSKVDGIWGAVHGAAGILEEKFFDLNAMEHPQRLRTAPASAIGTSRTPLEEGDYARMAQILKKHNIRFLLFTGGNGSMDTCGKLAKACAGMDIVVGGIPKTIDNDIAVTDHAPGYGSAARFAAQLMREIAEDVAALPIHVCIVEYMGRNAGWITAAAALARSEHCTAPDMILLPEIPFDEDRFLCEVTKYWKRGHGVTVAVSEGIHYKDSTPVAPLLFQTGRSSYFGDVSSTLARLVVERLGIKARSEKPGILGRCCPEFASDVDRAEAEAMGALAARTVLDGQGGMMSGFERISSQPYLCREVLIPMEKVMLEERLLPESFIDSEHYDITDDFLIWARPLIGSPLPEYPDCRIPNV